MSRLYSFQLNARENQEHTRYQHVCCENPDSGESAPTTGRSMSIIANKIDGTPLSASHISPEICFPRRIASTIRKNRFDIAQIQMKETRRAAVKPGLEEALLPKSPDDAFVSDQPAVPVVAPGNRGTRGEMPSIRA